VNENCEWVLVAEGGGTDGKGDIGVAVLAVLGAGVTADMLWPVAGIGGTSSWASPAVMMTSDEPWSDCTWSRRTGPNRVSKTLAWSTRAAPTNGALAASSLLIDSWLWRLPGSSLEATSGTRWGALRLDFNGPAGKPLAPAGSVLDALGSANVTRLEALGGCPWGAMPESKGEHQQHTRCSFFLPGCGAVVWSLSETKCPPLVANHSWLALTACVKAVTYKLSMSCTMT